MALVRPEWADLAAAVNVPAADLRQVVAEEGQGEAVATVLPGGRLELFGGSLDI